MKFAKLLPEEGWTPIVATPSNPDHPVTDASLNAEVADVETWRFPIWEPSRTLRAWGVGGQGRLGAERRGQGSLLSRMAKWVRGNMFVPDARVTGDQPQSPRSQAQGTARGFGRQQASTARIWWVWG